MMIRLLFSSGLALGLMFTPVASAEMPQPVKTALQQAGIPLSSVGLYVRSVEGNAQPILAEQAEVAFNPASVMKMLTSYVALEALTPAYRWKTEVYYTGEIRQGVLHGDLILKGYGDPAFDAAAFWRLLMQVQQAGIQDIRGHLVIDKGYFSDALEQLKPLDQERWRAYNAPPSAFLVNGRHTSFRFQANAGRVDIQQEFALPEISIINRMRPVKGRCNGWRSAFRYEIDHQGDVVGENALKTVTFTGDYPEECGERYLELSLFSDTEYAFFTFKRLWQMLGGKFNGELLVQDLTIRAKKLTEVTSPPLSDVVKSMNKWSNNLIARQLMLTIAAERQAFPPDQLMAAAEIQHWLRDKGYHFPELEIENGSGLSRKARINASHVGQLLYDAYRSPVMPEFVASLSIIGLDGTASKRLADTPLESHAHVKTGSLEGVNALAGYVLSASGLRYAVVFLINHPKAHQGYAAQEALLEWVYHQAR